MLDGKADAVLEELVAVQQNDRARALIEQHRLLLARCREVGIAAAFAEQQENQAQSPESESEATRLNALCQQVVATLRIGDMTRCEALATHLENQEGAFSMDGAGTFLALLTAWLRGEEIAAREETLQSAFLQVYQQMNVAVAAEQDQEDVDEIADDTAKREWTVHDSARTDPTCFNHVRSRDAG